MFIEKSNGYAIVYSFIKNDSRSSILKLEVKISKGLPYFDILAKTEQGVRACKGRVRAAIESAKFIFPNRRITVSIYSEITIRQISDYDFPIAIGILLASEQISINCGTIFAVGELELSGGVRPYWNDFEKNSTLFADFNMFEQNEARSKMILANFINFSNSSFDDDSSTCFDDFPRNLYVYVNDLCCLKSIAEFNNTDYKLLKKELDIWNKSLINNKDINNPKLKFELLLLEIEEKIVEFSKNGIYEKLEAISGQQEAIRALKIALTGFHSTIFLGSPGCGKSLISELLNLISILLYRYMLKEMLNDANLLKSFDIETEVPTLIQLKSSTTVASICGGRRIGKSIFQKCENSVIYCDELLELSSAQLTSLKQAMDTYYLYDDNTYGVIKNYNLRNDKRLLSNKCILDKRNNIFIASLNPCKCGNLLERGKSCTCSEYKIRQYWSKLPMSFVDRINIWRPMYALNESDLSLSVKGNKLNIDNIVEEIYQARKLNLQRMQELNLSTHKNSLLNHCDLQKVFSNNDDCIFYLSNLADFYHLSARSFHTVLKLAMSIASLDQRLFCNKDDINEAIQLKLERSILERLGLDV